MRFESAKRAHKFHEIRGDRKDRHAIADHSKSARFLQAACFHYLIALHSIYTVALASTLERVNETMRSLATKCHVAIALSLVLISSFAFSVQDPDSPVLVMQTGHAGYIRAIDISQNSEIAVTGADDSSIRVWQLPSGIEFEAHFYRNGCSRCCYLT